MKEKWMTAALAALLLTGCASTTDKEHSSSYKQIDVISGIDVPKSYVYLGQIQASDTSDLKDRARAMGADAITSPTFVGIRGLFQSDAYRYK
jgi:uncharacterized protein YcfL